MQKILDHTNQNQSYMCALMEKDHWVNPACKKDMDDKERFYVMSKAQGWYLEWELNETTLLIIKSTCQEDIKTKRETRKVKRLLKAKCINSGRGNPVPPYMEDGTMVDIKDGPGKKLTKYKARQP